MKVNLPLITFQPPIRYINPLSSKSAPTYSQDIIELVNNSWVKKQASNDVVEIIAQYMFGFACQICEQEKRKSEILLCYECSSFICKSCMQYTVLLENEPMKCLCKECACKNEPMFEDKYESEWSKHAQITRKSLIRDNKGPLSLVAKKLTAPRRH